MKARRFLVSFELTFDGDYWEGDSRLGPAYVSDRLGDTLRLGIEDSRMGPIRARELCWDQHDQDDHAEVVRLARMYVAEHYWCPICETTIGNGSVMHSDDCPLFAKDDR